MNFLYIISGFDRPLWYGSGEIHKLHGELINHHELKGEINQVTCCLAVRYWAVY